MIISQATFNLHDASVSSSLLSAIPLLFLILKAVNRPLQHLNTAFKIVFNGYIVTQYIESEVTQFHFSCFFLNLSNSISWSNSPNNFLVSDNYKYRLHKILCNCTVWLHASYNHCWIIKSHHVTRCITSDHNPIISNSKCIKIIHHHSYSYKVSFTLITTLVLICPSVKATLKYFCPY